MEKHVRRQWRVIYLLGGCELWPFYENEKGEQILLSMGCK